MPTQLPSQYKPGYDGTLSRNYRVISSRFGDAYEKIVPDGLGSVVESWSMTFPGLSKTDGDNLQAFFDGLKGCDAVIWTPPNSSVGKNYLVRNFTRKYEGDYISTITCTFELTYSV